jgi:hypothetical protein
MIIVSLLADVPADAPGPLPCGVEGAGDVVVPQALSSSANKVVNTAVLFTRLLLHCSSRLAPSRSGLVDPVGYRLPS